MEARDNHSSPLNVLIADDSVLVCRRLTSLLGSLDGIVIRDYAHDVKNAIQCIRRDVPDVVILDIQMPGGSGMSVLESTRCECPSTVFIVLTNYPYPQYRKRYLDAGANFFLDKSTEFERLVTLIDELRESDTCNAQN